MSRDLTPDHIRKIAKLSRLAIPEDQIEDYRSRLAAVLTYIDRLQNLDLTGFEPMAHIGDELNRLADDIPGPTLPLETVMRLAPQTMPPFIKVPKVIGEGGAA